MSAMDGQNEYLDASFWQYGGKYEWGKTTAEHDDGL